MFSIKSHYDNHPRVTVHTDLVGEEKEVDGRLAMTPTDMERLRQNGTPISQTNLEGLFFDGLEDPSFDLPPDFRRGVDAADLYQLSRDAAKNISKGQKKAKEIARWIRKAGSTRDTSSPVQPVQSVSPSNT